MAEAEAAGRLDVSLAVWSTRTIVQFVAATVPVQKGRGNPLLKAAAKVGKELLRADSEDDEGRPPDPRPGSFERFMGLAR